ncbi:MAG: hypothetical protein M1546_02120 [Chloroflexi bacterium]|nr:hypothetical protein [Chloroflexota bacterium]
MRVYDGNGDMTQRVEVVKGQRITYTQGWIELGHLYKEDGKMAACLPATPHTDDQTAQVDQWAS